MDQIRRPVYKRSLFALVGAAVSRGFRVLLKPRSRSEASLFVLSYPAFGGAFAQLLKAVYSKNWKQY